MAQLIRKDGPFEIRWRPFFGHAIFSGEVGFTVFSGSPTDCEILLLWWQEWEHGWPTVAPGVWDGGWRASRWLPQDMAGNYVSPLTA